MGHATHEGSPGGVEILGGCILLDIPVFVFLLPWPLGDFTVALGDFLVALAFEDFTAALGDFPVALAFRDFTPLPLDSDDST